MAHGNAEEVQSMSPIYELCPKAHDRPIEQMINPSLTFPEFKKTDAR